MNSLNLPDVKTTTVRVGGLELVVSRGTLRMNLLSASIQKEVIIDNPDMNPEVSYIYAALVACTAFPEGERPSYNEFLDKFSGPDSDAWYIAAAEINPHWFAELGNAVPNAEKACIAGALEMIVYRASLRMKVLREKVRKDMITKYGDTEMDIVTAVVYFETYPSLIASTVFPEGVNVPSIDDLLDKFEDLESNTWFIAAGEMNPRWFSSVGDLAALEEALKSEEADKKKGE